MDEHVRVLDCFGLIVVIKKLPDTVLHTVDNSVGYVGKA